MTDDPVAAALAEVRAGLEDAALAFPAAGMDLARASFAAGTLYGNARKALDAVDAVLALPAKWAGEDGNLPSSALTEDRAWVREKCAEDMRAAILTALTGGKADG